MSLSKTNDEKLNNHANVIREFISKGRSEMVALEDTDLTIFQEYNECTPTFRTIFPERQLKDN